MATDWLGSIVSISCGESLGVYQGRVSAVDQVSQTISLTRPFHNGVKCLVPEVTFRAGDITELKILEIPGLGESQNSGDLHQPELGPSGVGYQVGINQNGTGKLVKKPTSSSSAPQTIPRRTDMRSQDATVSPQQHCSRSYVDRHVESLSQSKSFRRRHNSYVTGKEISCSRQARASRPCPRVTSLLGSCQMCPESTETRPWWARSELKCTRAVEILEWIGWVLRGEEAPGPTSL